jgi:hypothetical protein
MVLQAIEIIDNGLVKMVSRWLTVLDEVVKGFVSPHLSARRLDQAKAGEKSCAKEHLCR